MLDLLISRLLTGRIVLTENFTVETLAHTIRSVLESRDIARLCRHHADLCQDSRTLAEACDLIEAVIEPGSAGSDR